MKRRIECMVAMMLFVSVRGVAAQSSHPSPLLAIDQHRATVVERVVVEWSDKLAATGAAIDREQLRAMLFAMRADQLLAASLAGSIDGLRDVLAHALTATAAPKGALVQTKALGDPNDDLVYTPVVPCRIVDTRLGAGGVLLATNQRNWLAHSPGGFAAQGGSATDCGVAVAPAAVMINVTLANTVGGPEFFTAWPFNQPRPNASTVNWSGPNQQPANAEIVPLCTSGGCTFDFSVYSSGQTQAIIDIVGYFNAPSGAGSYFAQGGNTFGTIAKLGTLDNQRLDIVADNQRVMHFEPNATSPNVIGGHANNLAYIGVEGATIAGGGAAGTTAFGFMCTGFFGDCRNAVSDSFGTVGGGAANFAGDGFSGTLNSLFATVGGGLGNTASGGLASTVAGGLNNVASGNSAIVAGGYLNVASGSYSTVGGGIGNVASGTYATVPGGLNNKAIGDYSFAAGISATVPAGAYGSFFWSDSTGAVSLPANSHDVFVAIATNGIGFYTFKDYSHGCYILGAAASWTCTSDRATKADIAAIDPRDVLARLVDTPVSRWRFKGEPEAVRHMGPMAQDFRASFGLGYDDKGITGVDADGVAFAAIQGLHQLVQEKDARIGVLERAVADLKRMVESLAAKQ